MASNQTAMLLLLLCLCGMQGASSLKHSGYIIDLFCWDKPGHVAIDGADLDTNPGAHSVHCMVDIADCRANGFGLLEMNSMGGYDLKYKFDADGNAKALEMLDALKAAEGGGRREVVVDAEGTLGSDGETLSLSSIRAAAGGSATTTPMPAMGQLLGSGVTIKSAVVDKGLDKVTVTVKSESSGWLAFGVTKSGSGMTGGGGGSDVMVCTSQGVKRYWITEYKVPTDGTDVADATCSMVGGTTEMTFTRTLSGGSRQREINPGKENTWIWAIGNDDDTTLARYHKARGTAELDIGDLDSGVKAVTRSNAAMWAHVAFMAVAAGWCWPWGSAIAARTKNVIGAPQGAWFKAHRIIQVVGWLFALIGVACGVAFVDTTFPSHFIYSHTIVGLIAFVLAFLQPLNAAIRPHPAQEGQPKTTARAVWEFVHKFSGWVAVWMGFGAIISGGILVLQLDGTLFPDSMAILGLVVGMAGFFTYLCFVALTLVNPNNAISRAIVGAGAAAPPPKEPSREMHHQPAGGAPMAPPPMPQQQMYNHPMQMPQQQMQMPQQQMYYNPMQAPNAGYAVPYGHP